VVGTLFQIKIRLSVLHDIANLPAELTATAYAAGVTVLLAVVVQMGASAGMELPQMPAGSA
jgi:hypothetical protein